MAVFRAIRKPWRVMVKSVVVVVAVVAAVVVSVKKTA